LLLIDRLLVIGVKIIFLGKVLLFKINRLRFYALLCRRAAFYGSNSLVNAIIIELDSIVTFTRVREGTEGRWINQTNRRGGARNRSRRISASKRLARHP